MNCSKKIVLLLFLTIYKIALSQKSDSFLDIRDSKHQISIAASRFINSVFPTDKNAYLLTYRFKKNKKYHYRLGLNYNLDTSEGGTVDFGAKIGYDKLFKRTRKWEFYYGFELGGMYHHIKESDKHLGAALVNSFLGIMFNISKHFSISTEPGIFIKYNFVIDNGSFDKEANKKWIDSGFSNVGIINLNFHF